MTAQHVVIGIIWHDRRLLVARRLAERHLGGLWEFPGGKVRDGESAVAALAREIAEEVGIRVRIETPLPEWRHAYADRVVRICPFFCQYVAGPPRPLEVAEVLWVWPSELAQLPFPPANGALIEALVSGAMGGGTAGRKIKYNKSCMQG